MKTWIKKVFGYGLASFFGDFSHEMTVSLIPVLVAQFVGVDQAPLYLGIISSVTDGFASFLRIISGLATDRTQRKKLLIVLGYSISAVFSTLVGFAHSVWTLLLFRMISFTGSGLREPPRDALIAATVGAQNYGRAFGLRNAMDTLGALVGPLVAFACATRYSVREIFILSFIPGILAVFSIIFLTENIKTVTKNIRKIEPFWKDFALLPRSFIIFLCILFIFDLSCFNKLLLLARTQEIITANKSTIPQFLIILYALFNMTRAVTEFAIGWLSDYVNRIFLLAIFGCGIFSLVSLLLITSKASFSYCLLVFILSGISAGALLTMKKACAADMLPEDIRGLGYGLMQAGEGSAALIANTLIGILWTRYSALVSFSYVAFLSFIAMFLLLLFFVTKNITKKQIAI